VQAARHARREAQRAHRAAPRGSNGNGNGNGNGNDSDDGDESGCGVVDAGRTAGEFDVLFRAAAAPGAPLLHAELSVKFLLFTAQPFTLAPDSRRGGGGARGACDAGTASAADADALRVWWAGGPRGEYIGPHAGETLGARVAHMRRQLGLPSAPHAQAYLREAFGCRRVPIADVDDDVAVRSCAFLKGWLFYPHAAWAAQRQRDAAADGTAAAADTGAAAAAQHRTPGWHPLLPPAGAADARADARAGAGAALAQVSAAHWCGWWSDDVAAVAGHACHAGARWRVLPKREWLSPARCGAAAALLDAAGLRAAVAEADAALAAELSAAAAADAATPPPTRKQRGWAEARRRQRRLLVAEMRPAAAAPDAARGADAAGAADAGDATWVEVSRGFLVEPGWPRTAAA
jgi:hypothetical protein